MATTALVIAGIVPAQADDDEDLQQIDGFEALEDYELDVDPDDYIDRLSYEDHVDTLDYDGHVDELEEVEEDDGETTISLATDILFDPQDWEISDSAAQRIEELIEDVPDDAEVTVTGHTDSRPTTHDVDFDNQDLSENRATAVAEVIEDDRSDLQLEVSGVADEDPAVDEDEDDPETFAQNRRVEIIYGSDEG